MSDITLVVTHDGDGGTYVWAKNFVLGLTEEDCTVHVIKSNRQKNQVHHDPRYEHVVKTSAEALDLITELDSDFTIFQSIYDGKKYMERFPIWRETIESMTTPFTFSTHDHALSYKEPFGAALWKMATEHKHFVGDFIGVSYMPKEMYADKGILQHHSRLPYRLDHPPTKLVGTGATYSVGGFAHVTKVKQWSLLLRAGILDDMSWERDGHSNPLQWRIYGGAASSPAICSTTKVAFDILARVEGAKMHAVFKDRLYSNVHKPFPWTIQLKNGNGLHYAGPFDAENKAGLMAYQDCVVNTTVRCGGSQGPIEYTSMEAVAEGVPIVAPTTNVRGYEHLVSASYFTMQNQPKTTPAIMLGQLDLSASEIGVAVRNVIDRESGQKRDARLLAFKALHNPQVVAHKYLEDIGAV